MPKVRATYLYSGLSDYWGGDGRRWDNDAGCVFAYYDGSTTLGDLFDQMIDDFHMGGDFLPGDNGEDVWEDITDEDIHEALMGCLNAVGRRNYENDVPWDDSVECDENSEYPVCIFLLELEDDNG